MKPWPWQKIRTFQASQWTLRLILIAAAFSFADSTWAMAAEAAHCRSIYSSQDLKGPLENWTQLVSASNVALSPKLKTELDQNPTVKSLRKKYGQGENVRLSIERNQYSKFVNSGEHAGNGWEIQGSFLGALISHILPKAVTDSPSDSKIKATLYDPTFDALVPRTDPIRRFDMTLLKAANPGPALPSKSKLRTQMNIPKKARVASVYIGGLIQDGTKKEDIALLTALLETNQADIILLSAPISIPTLTSQLKPNENLQIISSIDWPQIKPNKKVRYIIVNETRGIMNALHKAADYTVVLGAGNIYEPLQVGTPVYFESKPEVIVSRGTTVAWSTYAMQTIKTGGGHAYSSIPELMIELQETNATPPRKPISETLNSRGETPLERILLQIEQMLEEGVR